MSGIAPPARAHVELIEVDTSDERRLEGFLYEPSARPSASVLLLHGKGGNAYSGASRFLPPLLAAAGVRCLALNMRCHDLGYTRMDTPFVDLEHGDALVDGGMWEDLTLGKLDVAAGISFLIGAGADDVVLAGHSSGGFYAVTHSPTDAQVRGRLLLSPLVSNRRPLPMWFGGEDGLERALVSAQAHRDEGAGHALIATRGWYYAISADSLLQRAVEDPAVFEKSLDSCATAVHILWGDKEGRGDAWRQLASGRANVTTKAIDGAEHNYIGHEEEVGGSVIRFLNTLT